MPTPADSQNGIVIVRISELLPKFQDAIEASRTATGWDAELLQQIVAHEFDFLGPFIRARVRQDTSGDLGDEVLVIEFTPPRSRDLAVAERRFAQATKRADRGDAGGARPSLEGLVREFPEVAKFHRALGQVHFALNDWDSAEDEFLRSLAIDPRDPDALTLLGNLYVKRKAPEKAVPLYRRSLELEKNVYALSNIGAAFAQIGDLDEAIGLFREAITLEPTYPNAWYGLGLAISHTQDTARLPEAIAALDRALEAAKERTKAPDVWDAARALLSGLAEVAAREQAERAHLQNQELIGEQNRQGELPVQVQQVQLSGHLARLELGWPHNRPFHRLLVSPTAGIEREHQIRHELEHLRLTNMARAAGRNRWFTASAKDREFAVRSLAPETKRLARQGISELDLKALSLTWIDGLLLQLYNFPIDLLIESRLITDYPTLRELWFFSLARQLEVAARIAEDRQLAQATARTVYRASTAMNGAFVLWFEDQFPRRTDFVARFQRTQTWPTSKRLYSMWVHDFNSWEPGQEFAWIDSWARALGLTHWYTWRDDAI